ncbi:MAG TPA: aspartate aminotransferase family protein [Fermentimonas caenicola]|uniref:Acetylornithine aminotransferase n=1 Tax=Fermentimonas caenicola TaxID=1562970 RepID=A0A098BXN0_9BACT|nr:MULTISPECIES: aspartate aminotransferase family protein [Lascolabacillus]MBP6175259.1 aspartate aminotransferase family protein [Fermentimonas sp.]MDI9625945.1 aspartate aminotransferase family protein [Bacteroidota bacterium]TAH61547.1 MAG: aspartate aminotransferase family protein [Fermentimonas caenicola]MBP6196894.1 aspartate aminotransferase family protein [Fermentimonas sp.]MCK9501991.1 aspartate aminotransferase family protein [Lascolabacillus sp.]
MELFDVYSLWNIEPVKAKGCHVWDNEGNEYLDLYGGHAVISIGHSHPVYIKAISDQVEKIGFYSNSVLNSLQKTLAQKLGEQSGYTDYSLFLCNSGAEANENALKLASFYTGKSRVIAFKEAFHGRTSGAVAITDNPDIQSPFNSGHEVTFSTLNDIASVEAELNKGDVAAVIIEGIQGVAGIFVPEAEFLQQLDQLCKKHNVPLILDEIQSGYGRSGKFFAHQFADIKPDLITTAKGMGNGFPIGGLLISPKFEAKKGMLGTTFGGNHLACAAAIAVLDVIKDESLVDNAASVGEYLKEKLLNINGVVDVRGYGLMLGIEFKPEYSSVRNQLLFESHIFTGGAKNNIMRLLPPLSITKEEIDIFIDELIKKLN